MWPYGESANLIAWRALLGQREEGWRSRCDLEVAWLTSQFFTRRTQTARSRRTSEATDNRIHILVVGPVGKQDKWLSVLFDSVSWAGPRDSFYFSATRSESRVKTGRKTPCCLDISSAVGQQVAGLIACDVASVKASMLFLPLVFCRTTSVDAASKNQFSHSSPFSGEGFVVTPH